MPAWRSSRRGTCAFGLRSRAPDPQTPPRHPRSPGWLFREAQRHAWQGRIDVINLSLGHPIYESPDTDPLVRAVEDATRAGIVVVASAGNYGKNQERARSATPGSPRQAMRPRRSRSVRWTCTTPPTAATTRWRRTVRGDPPGTLGLAKPDLVAPGHRLVAVGVYGDPYNQILIDECGDGPTKRKLGIFG